MSHTCRASVRGRLVGEHTQDRRAEVRAELGGKAVVDEAYEALDGGRVEDTARRRRIFLKLPRALAPVVQPADHALRGPFDHGQPLPARPVADRHQVPVRLQLRRLAGSQVDFRQPPGGVGSVPRHHLAGRRAQRVHSLVVEHHVHLATRGLVDRHSHRVDHPRREPPDVWRQADPWMDHEPVHAVGLEVGDLPENLRVLEVVVPEPEGHHREFAGRADEAPIDRGSRRGQGEQQAEEGRHGEVQPTVPDLW
jgi:hypothetical protein